MRKISAEIEIQAPAERVWEVLTDFASYPEWNPLMQRVEGRPETGQRIEVEMRRQGGHRLRFPARVLDAERPRRIVWVGIGPRAHWPGLLRGERRIEIEPLGPARSRMRMETVFTGLASRTMRWLDAYRPGFEAMERALRDRAEGRA